jgi:alanine racemase
VVKANGYGLGATTVARALADAGCREFFVATAEEAVSLRAGGCQHGIYVFEGVTRENLAALAHARAVPVINSGTQLELWRPHRDRPAAVHVDTGMARLGFPVDVDAERFAGFRLELLLSHFACADEPNHEQNGRQAERFAAVAARFPGLRTSMGNSAAWLAGAAGIGDLGRPGIGLYGGNPFSDRANPLRTVARLEAQVLQLRTLGAGESVGYGATYSSPEGATLAVVGAGYADGLPRLLSNRGSLAWRGERCPIRGRVSMDLTVVDVSACPVTPAVGDWLECFGDVISLDEAAGWAGTIGYELLTGIGARVPRIYEPS